MRVVELSRVDQAVAFLALLELRKAGEVALDQSAPFRADKGFPTRQRKEQCMDRPLRLITANPLDQLARTLEALLVVASAPLSVEELAQAANDDAERVELAVGLLSDRFREGRQRDRARAGRGGYAYRASREAAAACGRLFERPVERGLSQARLETLAIVALPGTNAAGPRSPGFAASPPTPRWPASSSAA